MILAHSDIQIQKYTQKYLAINKLSLKLSSKIVMAFDDFVSV